MIGAAVVFILFGVCMALFGLKAFTEPDETSQNAVPGLFFASAILFFIGAALLLIDAFFFGGAA